MEKSRCASTLEHKQRRQGGDGEVRENLCGIARAVRTSQIPKPICECVFAFTRDTANTRLPQGSKLGPKEESVSRMVAPPFALRTLEFMADSRLTFVGGSSSLRCWWCGYVLLSWLAFSSDWNLDGDARTPFRPVGQMERAAMKVDNLPGHREAEPGALPDRFGGKEGLEKLGLVGGRNTDACIFNFGDEVGFTDPGSAT